MAKLILTHEVTGLGEPGDVVEVKDGYARNFLIPRSLATPWTKGAESQVSAIRKARKARELSTREDAEAAAASIQSKAYTIEAQAGESGRLFGAVTTADIATAVASAGGPSVDKRKIEIGQPIKSTGVHTVSIRLHPEVSAKIELEVVAG
ncbi:50S ribosomal protein L9 [Isoptericola croceus]|uniref:50S ribosomal protein L9 n=1 Tax=Isoptericola croceus TaxID=3031406 RepID=UPI0023F75F8B|nr:50S ribosomal protein L9 [Isoptericola croceus]